MLEIKEERFHRQTLDVKNLLTSSHIKTTSISNKHRFMFLAKNELDDLSWLKPIANDTTYSYIPPVELAANQAEPGNRISENLLTEKQPDSAADVTIDNFGRDLDMGSYQGKYVSIPIIDSKYANHIKNNLYQITQPYDEIELLHITSYKIVGKSGVGISSTVEVFTYYNLPTCEPVKIDFTKGTPECTTFGYNHQDFYIPYAKVPEARIVAILSVCDLVDKEPLDKPIAVGHKLISEIIDAKEISLDWVVFNPAQTLVEHFTSEKKFPMFNLVFEQEKVTGLPSLDIPPARITNFQPMYPSPLLTVHSIKVNIPSENLQKGSQCFLNITLRTSEENPTVLKFAAKPNQTVECESYRTSTVNANDIINFPGQVNFKLNTRKDYPVPLELFIELCQFEGTKCKVLCEAAIPLTESCFSVQQKLKGHSIFGSVQGTISLAYNFPAIVAPPSKLVLSLIAPPKKRPVITNTSIPGSRSSGQLNAGVSGDFDIDYKHPMFQDIAPYILQYLFDPVTITQVDFSQLAERIQNCRSEWLYKWIEHSFSCPDTFPTVYIKLLAENIMDISLVPLPFFLVLHKAMVASHSIFFDEVSELLAATSKPQVPLSVKKAAGEFIRQLRMSFAPDFVMKLARRFIFNLSTAERLEIFQLFFCDAAFIHSIFVPVKPIKDETFIMSPYIPLLSLFYSTVRDTFLANSKIAIDPAMKAIGLLGVSIESYTDKESMKQIAMYFFPLVTLIFTFYDSLLPHLNDDPVFVPLVLSVCKSMDSTQFLQYFNILSDDNKLRFFDFLASLSDESTINALSERIVVINSSRLEKRLDSIKLTVSLEITCRLLIFLHFIDKVENISNNRHVQSIFKILIHMLSPSQDSEAFPMVFKSFAFIVTKFAQVIFVEQTNHIYSIMTSVVALTQRKVALARICSTAFLIWLTKKELCTGKKGSKEKAKGPIRCFIGLNFACVKSLFENPNFDFVATSISPEFSVINDMIPSIKKAWTESKIYFKCVEDLKTNFSYVASVQGAGFLVVKQMEKINEENGDYIAAFFCQWKLCAMIANVFKLRGQTVDGIPTGGAEDFPFLDSYDEFNLNADAKTDAYLLLEGPMFTEQSICEEMQKAMTLCQKANLHWCIGQITEYLLNYLENHRMFEDLRDIYMKIATSYGSIYSDLEKGEATKHVFYLVCFRGVIRQEIKHKNTIMILPSGGEASFKAMIEKAYPNVEFSAPSPLYYELEKKNKVNFDKNKSYVQMVRVNCNKADLEALKCYRFSLDVISEEKDWDDVYVIKHEFITSRTRKVNGNEEQVITYLPSLISSQEIGQHMTEEITRKEYYKRYLTEYYKEIMNQVTEFRCVLPPKKLEQQWTKWSLWLNTKLLLRLIGRTLDEYNETAPLAFVYKVKTQLDKRIPEIENMKQEDADALLKLVNDVWDALSAAASVLDDLMRLNNRDRIVTSSSVENKIESKIERSFSTKKDKSNDADKKVATAETAEKILERYKLVLNTSKGSDNQ